MPEMFNTTRLAEETKDIFDRGNMTTYVLKEKLIKQDQTLPAKYDQTEYRKEVKKLIKKKVDEQAEKEQSRKMACFG